MSLKIDKDAIAQASHAELNGLIEKLKDELEARRFNDELVRIIKVDNFGVITYHRCPVEAIESLSDVLVGSIDDPLSEVWRTPDPKGIGRHLSISSVMMKSSEIEAEGNWWRG